MGTSDNRDHATESVNASRPILVSVQEASRLISMTRSATWDLVRSGDLPSVRVGRRVLVPVRGIGAWVARLQQAS